MLSSKHSCLRGEADRATDIVHRDSSAGSQTDVSLLEMYRLGSLQNTDMVYMSDLHSLGDTQDHDLAPFSRHHSAGTAQDLLQTESDGPTSATKLLRDPSAGEQARRSNALIVRAMRCGRRAARDSDAPIVCIQVSVALLGRCRRAPSAQIAARGAFYLSHMHARRRAQWRDEEGETADVPLYTFMRLLAAARPYVT